MQLDLCAKGRSIFSSQSNESATSSLKRLEVLLDTFRASTERDFAAVLCGLLWDFALLFSRQIQISYDDSNTG
jgi:hypothetical protein